MPTPSSTALNLSLRYANVVGFRLRHDIICDLINKLRKIFPELEIIQQQASQKLHYIDDSVKATLP